MEDFYGFLFKLKKIKYKKCFEFLKIHKIFKYAYTIFLFRGEVALGILKLFMVKRKMLERIGKYGRFRNH